MNYLFTLQKDYTRFLTDLVGVYFECEWGSIDDGMITIKKGYSWDGCTCALNTKRTYNACLVHDFLCQFEPIPIVDADRLFMYLLESDRFELSTLYFFAVYIYHTIKKMLIFAKTKINLLCLIEKQNLD